MKLFDDQMLVMTAQLFRLYLLLLEQRLAAEAICSVFHRAVDESLHKDLHRILLMGPTAVSENCLIWLSDSPCLKKGGIGTPGLKCRFASFETLSWCSALPCKPCSL